MESPTQRFQQSSSGHMVGGLLHPYVIASPAGSTDVLAVLERRNSAEHCDQQMQANKSLPDRVSYTISLITSGVLLHFVHDGASSPGFPWLSPFSQARFRFRSGKPIVVPRVETEQWMSYWKTRERSAADGIGGRNAPGTMAH